MDPNKEKSFFYFKRKICEVCKFVKKRNVEQIEWKYPVAKCLHTRTVKSDIRTHEIRYANPCSCLKFFFNTIETTVDVKTHTIHITAHQWFFCVLFNYANPSSSLRPHSILLTNLVLYKFDVEKIQLIKNSIELKKNCKTKQFQEKQQQKGCIIFRTCLFFNIFDRIEKKNHLILDFMNEQRM